MYLKKCYQISEIIKKNLPEGLILITGLGASGKTVLAKQLAKLLKAELLHFDQFHYDEDLRRPKGITGCHPECFDCEKAKQSINNLNSKYKIVDGLSACHLDCYDFIIFLETSVEEEKKRRLKRDIKRRPIEDVITIFNKRREQYHKYIEPYKEKADLIIKSKPDYSLEIENNINTYPSN